MEFRNRLNQKLHEEHCATIALADRLEQLLARHARGAAPEISDRGVVRLLRDLYTAIESELTRHFDFEENYLFEYLTAGGEAEIGAHLMDDHRAIRPIGAALAKLARGAVAHGFEQETWDEFRRLAGEFCERIQAHVQKEETALLPLLDDSMDADADARLLEEYLAIA